MVSRHTLTMRAGRSERSLRTQSKRRRGNLLFVLLMLITYGCNPASPSPTTAPVPEATQPTDAPTPAPDYVSRICNAQYQLGLLDSLRVVQLVDGKFEEGSPGGADFVSVTVTDFIARGDLNSDGVDEVAALVAENYGGSGVFVFLVAYADVNGQLVYQTASLADDRPMLNALSIEGGEIFLDSITHGADDPFCCPALRNERHYRLTNNQLEMTDYVTFTPDGRPRTITIETPAHGAEVFSSVQIKGSVAIAPFENNLTYRIFDVGGVELSAGAVAVIAADLGAPGTFDSVINLGGLLSGATIRVEIQDISAADGSLFAMDSVELVVK